MDPLGTQRANHVPASTESGSQAPASQSPDSNQNINNQETTPVALTFTMILETHTGQSSNRCRFPSALEWRVALCTFAKQTKNKTKQNPDPLSVSCLLLTRSVCGQEHTVLLLGPVYQLPLLLLVPLLLCFGWSLPSWAVPHGHLTSPGFSNGWTRYCVLRRLFHNLPCSGFQAPFKSTCAIISAASSPFTPMTDFTAF